MQQQNTPTTHPSCYVIHEINASASHSDVATHSEHGLIFVKDGWFSMEQKVASLSLKGSVTLVPSGVPHRPLAGENLNYWLLGFSASNFNFSEEQQIMRAFAQVRLGAVPVIELNKKTQKKVETYFKMLQQEVDLNNSKIDLIDTVTIQRSLITLLLAEITRSIPTVETNNSQSALVSQALSFIQKNSFTSIGLSEVANHVNRTAPHVASVVKSETGFTVGTWITSARIAKATQLLKHTNMSIEQITIEVGWNDTTHFIRQFKKIHKITPAVWRKENHWQ